MSWTVALICILVDCKGSGTVTRQQSTIFGSFLSKTSCPTCHGTGSTFDKICTNCHGTGKERKVKTLTITIPKGINTGNRIRLAGKGEAVLMEENQEIYILNLVLKKMISILEMRMIFILLYLLLLLKQY